MKYFFSFCCFFLLAIAPSVAQQTHFIYLQTDNHQPFYVMMKSKNYSSSSIGYVILPKLENGEYRIKVGFAKSETPEQEYILQINDNDLGFLIKDFGDKGGGLFNLQTMAIQYSGEEAHKLDAVANAKRDAENQKLIAQQQKDSTEKAEALLAEQQKAANEARIANETKQREQAAALAQKQAEENAKSENEARIALEAKQKKDAATLVKQQAADSLKAAKTVKVALKPQPKASATDTKQQAAAKAKAYKEYWAAQRVKEKLRADSLANNKAADSLRAENEAKMADAAAQKRAEEALAQQQAEEKIKADEQKRLDILAAQKATANALQKHKDSLAMAEKENTPTIAATVQNDTNQTAQPAPTTDKSVNATIVYQPVLVAKNTNDSGTNVVYKIPSNKGWDTVTAYIEAPVTDKKTIDSTTAPADKPSDVKFLDMHFKQDSADKAKDMITPVFKASKPAQTETVTDNTIVDTKPATASTTTDATTTKTDSKESASPMPMTNSNCRSVADDKDFFALRKKMVAKNDVDEMIMLAKKSMKEKCYSTFQIRNLSALMITDAERYQFLEMAYPFVSDANNYAGLSDLLKDNYYGDRFKAMLRK